MGAQRQFLVPAPPQGRGELRDRPPPNRGRTTVRPPPPLRLPRRLPPRPPLLPVLPHLGTQPCVRLRHDPLVLPDQLPVALQPPLGQLTGVDRGQHRAPRPALMPAVVE